MDRNFWYWLLEGQTQILFWVLDLLPAHFHNTVIDSAPTILYYAWAPLLTLIGTFMNLTLWALVVGIIFYLEGVRHTIGIYSLLGKLRAVFK